MPETICEQCGKECGKRNKCAAWMKLCQIYYEERTEEKHEIIKELRKLIGLVDYEPADDIKELAEKIISMKPELAFIYECDIKVGYVRAYESKRRQGRVTFADCRKINGPYLAYLPYDILITAYEPNMAWLTENQRKVVIYHELRHIDVNERGITVRPHDIEDFESILSEHGLNWSQPGIDVIDILAGGDDGAETGKQKAKNNSKKK